MTKVPFRQAFFLSRTEATSTTREHPLDLLLHQASKHALLSVLLHDLVMTNFFEGEV